VAGTGMGAAEEMPPEIFAVPCLPLWAGMRTTKDLPLQSQGHGTPRNDIA
jgi:hypothetical protein